MFFVVFLVILASAVSGLAVKWWLDSSRADKEITKTEYWVGVVLISLLVAPLATKAGWEIAKKNLITFNEYWNGWERNANRNDIQCTRDGPCRYEYDCDPYLCPYECGGYEGTGKDRHYVSKTCWKTCYHSCPYVKTETNYSVSTTLGDYEIASHLFPDNPQANRWRDSVDIPQHVIDRAGCGIPPFWAAVKMRVDSGKPGPVTQRRKYDNYILASDLTILKQYSDAIDKYRSAGLLSEVRREVYDFYYSDKVHFVGFSSPGAVQWQVELAYFNAAFGIELQGDLHLAVVQNDLINSNPDAYLLALKAYWQNPKVFGKDAISKNSIIMAIGTKDGKTIEWARAITGMPLGNEKLTVAVHNRLKGLPLNTKVIFGDRELKAKHASIRKSYLAKRSAANLEGYPLDEFGVLERIFWGLDESDSRFKRIAMAPDDPGGSGSGFLYLANDIHLTSGQKAAVFFGSLFVCMLVWLGAALIGERQTSWRRW